MLPFSSLAPSLRLNCRIVRFTRRNQTDFPVLGPWGFPILADFLRIFPQTIPPQGFF